MMKSIIAQTRLDRPTNLSEDISVFDAYKQNEKHTNTQQITWRDFQGLSWIFFEDEI